MNLQHSNNSKWCPRYNKCCTWQEHDSSYLVVVGELFHVMTCNNTIFFTCSRFSLIELWKFKLEFSDKYTWWNYKIFFWIFNHCYSVLSYFDSCESSGYYVSFEPEMSEILSISFFTMAFDYFNKIINPVIFVKVLLPFSNLSEEIVNCNITDDHNQAWYGIHNSIEKENIEFGLIASTWYIEAERDVIIFTSQFA